MNPTDETPTGMPTPNDDAERTAAAANDDAQMSEFARHGDPSRKSTPLASRMPGRGVDWVRPSDLMTRACGRVAGRGIDFHTSLTQQARRIPVHSARSLQRGVRTVSRAVSARARRLPPASAFGHGPGRSYSWVSRSGIGLG